MAGWVSSSEGRATDWRMDPSAGLMMTRTEALPETARSWESGLRAAAWGRILGRSIWRPAGERMELSGVTTRDWPSLASGPTRSGAEGAASWARRETAGTRARKSRGIIRRLWRMGRASARVVVYASGREVASEVGAAGEFEFEVGGGLPCGEGVEEGFRGIGADETGAVLAAEEAAGDHGVETGEDAVEEAVDVEDPDGVLVDGELAPCEDLEEFVEGAEAAWEGDEAVGEVDHELFAFVHGADDAHVGDPMVFEFAGVEEVGDDADDGAVGGERAICGGTHHADTAAAVDHADAAGGEERAGFEGDASVAEVISWAGATIDGEGAEHGRGIGEKWEEVNGKRAWRRVWEESVGGFDCRLRWVMEVRHGSGVSRRVIFS